MKEGVEIGGFRKIAVCAKRINLVDQLFDVGGREHDYRYVSQILGFPNEGEDAAGVGFGEVEIEENQGGAGRTGKWFRAAEEFNCLLAISRNVNIGSRNQDSQSFLH